MLRHICGQNETGDSLPEVNKLSPVEVLQEITILFLHDPKQLSSMVIFLNGHIIAVDGPLSDGVQVVAVRKAIMAEIVTNSCNNHAQVVYVSQFKGQRQVISGHH